MKHSIAFIQDIENLYNNVKKERIPENDLFLKLLSYFSRDELEKVALLFF